MGHEASGSISIDSPATAPTFSHGLTWLVAAFGIFFVGGLTNNYLLGGAAFFAAGVSAALLAGAARKKLNPGRPAELLPAQVQQLHSELHAVQAELERLREEHEFDRQLGRSSSGPGAV